MTRKLLFLVLLTIAMFSIATPAAAQVWCYDYQCYYQSVNDKDICLSGCNGERWCECICYTNFYWNNCYICGCPEYCHHSCG